MILYIYIYIYISRADRSLIFAAARIVRAYQCSGTAQWYSGAHRRAQCTGTTGGGCHWAVLHQCSGQCRGTPARIAEPPRAQSSASTRDPSRGRLGESERSRPRRRRRTPPSKEAKRPLAARRPAPVAMRSSTEQLGECVRLGLSAWVSPPARCTCRALRQGPCVDGPL
jgi:hypothetical protein